MKVYTKYFQYVNECDVIWGFIKNTKFNLYKQTVSKGLFVYYVAGGLVVFKKIDKLLNLPPPPPLKCFYKFKPPLKQTIWNLHPPPPPP
jgi:hypothetical protein